MCYYDTSDPCNIIGKLVIYEPITHFFKLQMTRKNKYRTTPRERWPEPPSIEKLRMKCLNH